MNDDSPPVSQGGRAWLGPLAGAALGLLSVALPFALAPRNSIEAATGQWPVTVVAVAAVLAAGAGLGALVQHHRQGRLGGLFGALLGAFLMGALELVTAPNTGIRLAGVLFGALIGGALLGGLTALVTRRPRADRAQRYDRVE